MRRVLSCGLLKWFYAFSQQHQAQPASHAFNSEKLKFKKIQKFHLKKHLMHLPSKLLFKKCLSQVVCWLMFIFNLLKWC